MSGCVNKKLTDRIRSIFSQVLNVRNQSVRNPKEFSLTRTFIAHAPVPFGAPHTGLYINARTKDAG